MSDYDAVAADPADDHVEEEEEEMMTDEQAAAEAEAEEELERAAEAAADEEGQEERKEGDTAGDGVRTLKRPSTAYFLYMTENRDSIIAELKAAAIEAAGGVNPPEEDGKRGYKLGDIGKIAGERWKAMSEEERESWQQRARELKDAYDAAILADPSLAPVRATKKNSGGELGADSAELVLQLGRVKKIMDLDPEKKKCSKDAAFLAGKATEHFIAWLGQRLHLHASGHKRKSIRAQDLEHVARTDKRLEFLRAPMRRDFERLKAMEVAQGEARKEKAEEQKRKKQRMVEEQQEQEGEEGEEKRKEGEEAGESDMEERKESDERDSPARSTAAAPAASKAKAKSKPAAPMRTIDSMFKRT